MILSISDERELSGLRLPRLSTLEFINATNA